MYVYVFPSLVHSSLKIWVSFAEYSLFYRALVQKRPIFSGSLQIIATPYLIPKSRTRLEELGVGLFGLIH